MEKSIKVAFLSFGGIGEFVLHLDAIRNYSRYFSEFSITIIASEEKLELGRILASEGHSFKWLSVKPNLENLVNQYDSVIVLRWFSEVFSKFEILDFVPKPELYEQFKAARSAQHKALRQFYDDGFHLRDIILKSSGMEYSSEIEPFLDALDNQEGYCLVSNDCDAAPSQSQTKQMPESMWSQLIGQLNDQNILTLETGLRGKGAKSHPRYVNKIGQTTITEWCEMISNAKLIVSIEGGMAHIAAFLNKRALVICGPTDSQAYGYPIHEYIASPFCTPCHWVTDTWFEICTLDNSRACMYSHNIDTIAAQVSEEFHG